VFISKLINDLSLVYFSTTALLLYRYLPVRCIALDQSQKSYTNNQQSSNYTTVFGRTVSDHEIYSALLKNQTLTVKINLDNILHT